MLAAQAIQCGDASVVVAGGMESMSRAPYLLEKARGGYRLGHGELIDSMLRDGLTDAYGGMHMGACGEQCAAKYRLHARAAGRFRRRQLPARSCGGRARRRVRRGDRPRGGAGRQRAR